MPETLDSPAVVRPNRITGEDHWLEKVRKDATKYAEEVQADIDGGGDGEGISKTSPSILKIWLQYQHNDAGDVTDMGDIKLLEISDGSIKDAVKDTESSDDPEEMWATAIAAHESGKTADQMVTVLSGKDWGKYMLKQKWDKSWK